MNRLLVGVALFFVGWSDSECQAQTQSGTVNTGEIRLPPEKPLTTAKDQAPTPPADGSKVIPITLETIFRLAESQNAQVGLARARVAEACAENSLAAKNWLPSLYIGTTYFRHEGGIANEDGTITRSSFGTLFGGLEISSKLDLRELTYQRLVAERNYWQEKGQLSRLTTETLVDAAATYIDMLTAHSSELIILDVQNQLQSLLMRAEKLAETEAGARIIAARIRSFLAGMKQNVVRARAEFARASAKLIYLLGLDPCATLAPLDQQLTPLELVDASVPCCDLVAQVLANGPGIQEVERIVALSHEAIDRSNGPGRFLPVFEARTIEGGFGTGPGDEMVWANRWDLGLQVRWNLTDLCTRCDRERILHAKAAQAHFANDDLRAKLAAAVQEARDSIMFGHEQIHLNEVYVDKAREVNKLALDRMLEMIQLASAYDEVLLSLEAIGAAQAAYLNAVRDFDKAQLRLLILLGNAASIHAPLDKNCPIPAQPRQ
jgi:outer membrane protein TolC